MQDFLTLAKERYSVRQYKSDAVSQDDLAYILEAAMIAPTACNNQGIHVYVLSGEEARANAKSVCKFTFDAPVVLCVCKDSDKYWKNPFEEGVNSGDIDASIVGSHMMLAARERELGTCWVGAFSPSKLKEALNLPKNHQPVLLMPLGHPADEATPTAMHTTTRPQEELITVM